jgi:hypothetical protein
MMLKRFLTTSTTAVTSTVKRKATRATTKRVALESTTTPPNASILVATPVKPIKAKPIKKKKTVAKKKVVGKSIVVLMTNKRFAYRFFFKKKNNQ